MISSNKNFERDLISNLGRKDNFNQEIFIFSDIKDIASPDEPVKVQIPIFALCTKGSGKIKINLKEYEVGPGDLITILSDHILHGYEISEDFEGLFLGVSLSYAEQISTDIHTLLPYLLNFKETPIIKLSEKEMDGIPELHSVLWRRIKNVSGAYDRKIIGHLMQVLLLELLNIYHGRNRFVPTQRSRNEEIFHKFVHLVESKFKVERSVAFYAEKLCVSPKHLSAVVKSVSGKTAGDWIDNYVIMTAKVLLRSSSRTIKEISMELNFANQSFFGKYFKQREGVSPNQYRAKSVHDV